MIAIEQEARTIVLAVLDRAPEQWPAFLDEACGDHSDVRARVEQLLIAHREMGSIRIGGNAGLETVVYPYTTEVSGNVLGSYKLLEQIGEGGFGVVFLAEQSHPVRRKVALKILKPGMDTKHVVARFEAERQALAIMDHPNIARVFDGGVTLSGRPYFVMELVRGVPITEFCDRYHLTTRKRLELFLSVCQAVQHAHQKGIIHRDLKPTNVLVSQHDTTPVVKVIDFGVAKALGQSLTDKSLYTGITQMIGTPLYMSPEQAGMSDLDIDTRSDIYSLGVLLYELLTGTTPVMKERFQKAGFDEIRRIIHDEDPPRPSTRLSESNELLTSLGALRQTEPAKLTKLVRGELDWIVMKALEKDRNRRYATANALAMDVQHYLADETVQACPPSAGYRFRKFARRNKGTLVRAAVLCGMLFVLFGGIAWVLSDRRGRLDRMAFEVNSFLQQAKLLYADNRLPEALSEVQKAHAVLGTTGLSDEELDRRVTQMIKELETASQLEEIILDQSSPPVARDRGYADYARVFREFGIDVETLPAEEAATRIANSMIKLDLVLALNWWATTLKSDTRRLEPARWLRLQEISRISDSDPWRQRYNAALEAKNLNELRTLANESDLSELRTRDLAVMGDSLRVAGDVKASVEFLRKVQWQYPSDYSINNSLAWSLRRLVPPQWNEAIAFRRIAVAMRPKSPTANFYLGYSLDQVEKRDEALFYLQKAVDLEPKHAPAQLSLALNQSVRGNTKVALEHFNICSSLLPTDPHPLNGLAWELVTCTKHDHRDPVLAVTLAKKVVILSRDQGDDKSSNASRTRYGNYWNTLGVAHYRAGNLVEARDALLTSLDIAKVNDHRYVCVNWLFLAMTMWKQDKKAEAVNYYDKAVKWMESKNQQSSESLCRFRTEAEELMKIAGASTTAPSPRK